MEIDAKKTKGFTNYKYCQLYKPVNAKNPNTYRLNIAFQWIRQDLSYESIVFKLKVPIAKDH